MGAIFTKSTSEDTAATRVILHVIMGTNLAKTRVSVTQQQDILKSNKSIATTHERVKMNKILVYPKGKASVKCSWQLVTNG
jgi:hypothetical protein